MVQQLILSAHEIIAEIIGRNGWFPNNSKFPLLLYKSCLNASKVNPQTLEEIFLSNDWKNPWRNGIYSFHHYHSNTQEVLGIYDGSCEVEIGGDHGKRFHLEKGDVLIIPAGVSHKNVGSTPDFKCIGAYPFEIDYDMNEGKQEEFSPANENIGRVPLPKADPVYGKKGPLFEYWK